jgi:hypothetical protein
MERIDMSDEKHDDFQHKYVGYVLLALVVGVVGIGVLGIIYFAITGGHGW